jgi:hypothetical protein
MGKITVNDEALASTGKNVIRRSIPDKVKEISNM